MRFEATYSHSMVNVLVQLRASLMLYKNIILLASSGTKFNLEAVSYCILVVVG